MPTSSQMFSYLIGGHKRGQDDEGSGSFTTAMETLGSSKWRTRMESPLLTICSREPGATTRSPNLNIGRISGAQGVGKMVRKYLQYPSGITALKKEQGLHLPDLVFGDSLSHNFSKVLQYCTCRALSDLCESCTCLREGGTTCGGGGGGGEA